MNPVKVDPRKMVSRKTPVSEVSTSFNPFGENNDNMMQYISVGVAAVAMGVCIFLYKEVKKVKGDVVDIGEEVKKLQTNEQLEENTKTIQSLEEKVNQIGTLLQHMAVRGQQQQRPVSVPVPPPQLPVKVKSEESVLPTLSGQEDVKIVKGGPECDDEEGICEIPEKKKKILEI